MKASKSFYIVLLLLCVSFTQCVLAQSLADLARQEREKKAQTSATPRLITNQDLHSDAPSPTPAASASPGATEKTSKPTTDLKGDTFALYALQSLAASLYLGSKMTENDKLTLADGTQKTVQIVGLTGYKLPSGWLYIAGIEFKEDQTAAFTAMLTSKPAPPALTNVFIFYLDKAGNLRTSQRCVLDKRIVATQLDEFHFPSAPKDGSWPIVQAVAWHWYTSPKWTGRVRFVSKIDTAKMTIVERLPVALSKKPNKADSIDDALDIEPIDKDTILIKGSTSGKSLHYPCGNRCMIDGERLLDSW